MKKIILFSPTGVKINLTSIEDRPLGGADTILIKTMMELSKKYEVHAYVPTISSLDFPQLKVKPFQDLLTDDNAECDIFIMYRKAWVIPPCVSYKKAIFYSQDDTDSPCFAGVDGTYFDKFDKIICLSQYHKKRLNHACKIKNKHKKIVILGNGANSRLYREPKNPLKFIYASTPFRGLVVLAKLWKQIVEKYPTAELHVFSSMAIYDGELQDKLYFNQLYDKIKKIKGIVYHGSVTQREVFECMDTCSMLLYPNVFPETYCNVVMEARACGCPIITSDRGALSETTGRAGICIKGLPYGEKYQNEFLDSVFRLIEDKREWQYYADRCTPIRTWGDWKEELFIIVGEL